MTSAAIPCPPASDWQLFSAHHSSAHLFKERQIIMQTTAEPQKKLEETSRQRVQLEFTPEAFERLRQIKILASATTNAEVVRNALRLYEWFLKQKADDYKFQLVKDNEAKEVELVL
jgi:hypothetical protein